MWSPEGRERERTKGCNMSLPGIYQYFADTQEEKSIWIPALRIGLQALGKYRNQQYLLTKEAICSWKLSLSRLCSPGLNHPMAIHLLEVHVELFFLLSQNCCPSVCKSFMHTPDGKFYASAGVFFANKVHQMKIDFPFSVNCDTSRAQTLKIEARDRRRGEGGPSK